MANNRIYEALHCAGFSSLMLLYLGFYAILGTPTSHTLKRKLSDKFGANSVALSILQKIKHATSQHTSILYSYIREKTAATFPPSNVAYETHPKFLRS